MHIGMELKLNEAIVRSKEVCANVEVLVTLCDKRRREAKWPGWTNRHPGSIVGLRINPITSSQWLEA